MDDYTCTIPVIGVTQGIISRNDYVLVYNNKQRKQGKQPTSSGVCRKGIDGVNQPRVVLMYIAVCEKWQQTHIVDGLDLRFPRDLHG